MKRRPGPASVRHLLSAILVLGAIHQTAAWPGVQAVFHALLVIGLAPEFRSPLVAALWAAAAGWVMEGSLRMYPHLGGTALANIVVCLLVAWTLIQWPPRASRPFWARLGAFAVLHMLLVHWMVLIAAGSHAWGTGPIWTLLTVPLWAAVAFKLYLPHYRE
jgi:hypothetical protein